MKGGGGEKKRVWRKKGREKKENKVKRNICTKFLSSADYIAWNSE